MPIEFARRIITLLFFGEQFFHRHLNDFQVKINPPPNFSFNIYTNINYAIILKTKNNI